jgi:dihydrofolate reductase
MRTIRILAHVSLDGIIQPEGDDDFARGGWSAPFRSPDGAAAVAAAQSPGFDLLLGRRTYDLWATVWPTVKGGPFADALNAATKYVATHRPDSLTWGPAESLGADVFARIRELKAGDGSDLIVWGSTTLTAGLLEQGLADEVVLMVCPVSLGRGLRFFAEDAAPRKLALVSTATTSTGVLINQYRNLGSLRAG